MDEWQSTPSDNTTIVIVIILVVLGIVAILIAVFVSTNDDQPNDDSSDDNGGTPPPIEFQVQERDVTQEVSSDYILPPPFVPGSTDLPVREHSCSPRRSPVYSPRIEYGDSNSSESVDIDQLINEDRGAPSIEETILPAAQPDDLSTASESNESFDFEQLAKQADLGSVEDYNHPYVSDDGDLLEPESIGSETSEFSNRSEPDDSVPSEFSGHLDSDKSENPKFSGHLASDFSKESNSDSSGNPSEPSPSFSVLAKDVEERMNTRPNPPKIPKPPSRRKSIIPKPPTGRTSLHPKPPVPYVPVSSQSPIAETTGFSMDASPTNPASLSSDFSSMTDATKRN